MNQQYENINDEMNFGETNKGVYQPPMQSNNNYNNQVIKTIPPIDAYPLNNLDEGNKNKWEFLKDKKKLIIGIIVAIIIVIILAMIIDELD